jgi:hypothetical protein
MSTAVPGVSYDYFVVTVNDCGEASPSAGDPGHRPQAPAAPSDLTVGGTQDHGDSIQVHLTWTDHSADEALQIVYLMNSPPVALDSLPPNVVAATVSFAKRGQTTYCFSVAATNCGIEARSD